MKCCASKMFWTQRSVFILFTYVAIAMVSFVAGQSKSSSGDFSKDVKCTERYHSIVF